MPEAKQAHERNFLTNLDPLDARKGSLKVATIGNVPVFLHWTLLVGMLPITAFTGFEPAASLYYFLACSALIVVHELGHVAAAVALKMKVFALHLNFLGGHCVLQRVRGVRETLIVYSAGFIAQASLLALTILCATFIGPPRTTLAMCVFNTFVVVNVVVLILNLIPVVHGNGVWNDGGVLWKLFLHVFKGRPHPFPDLLAPSTVFAPGVSLANDPAMVPAGFITGIEIMNDNTTPMEFVVSMLVKYLGLESERAIEMMLKVHGEGGMLISIDGFEASQAIATAIVADARAAGHKLVCRAVDTRDSARLANIEPGGIHQAHHSQ